MILRTRREKLINEFCANGNLETYRVILTKILDEFQASGVKISARYDVDFSNFEDYSTDNHTRIRISLRNVVEPLEVFWILFHEYGHFQSPKRKAQDNEVLREEMAWQYASSTLKNYPELAKYKESYDACRKRCLNSYYHKHGLPLIQ
ncbi:hypothetical protein ATE47_01540 [Chryseobacterium sp. IHB B 17019]|uniref:hypothetical protein n=1 Tax=Chryseobacterium sp. IHB B 17019 TaxID=1721091 RepID=UPI00072155E6|nr:hypothetical protein [Chryseobacterium sp. IHB B 17019]ALR29294.1 hypothetical protein ATE47_01540 [Chryseobacterium sp. IHB B 17019]